MMNAGRFWRTDPRGLLLNDADRAHLDSAFQPLIQAVIAQYVQHIANDTHSIYITGDIPRGITHLDKPRAHFLAVLERQVDPELVLQGWINSAQQQLKSQFSSLASEFTLDLYPQGYIFRDPDEFSIGAFIISTQSLCVWGSDITPDLPIYNMNHPLIPLAIANDDIVQCPFRIEESIDIIENLPTSAELADECQYICEHMILAAFALTMHHHHQYTRDVHLASQTFLQYFPAQSPLIQQAQALMEKVAPSPAEVLTFLRTDGAWLADQCNLWLDEHNPQGYDYFVFGNDPDYEP